MLTAKPNAEVKPTPSVSITPANSSVSLGSNFTLVMVDADIVGTDETAGQTRHWLVNGVSLSGAYPRISMLYPLFLRAPFFS